MEFVIYTNAGASQRPATTILAVPRAGGAMHPGLTGLIAQVAPESPNGINSVVERQPDFRRANRLRGA